MGCSALSGGTIASSARKARKAPPIIFSAPGMIQPGPAATTEAHQRPRFVFPAGGRKRRKSTCSPICAISAKATVHPAPTASQSNSLPWRPPNSVKVAYSSGSRTSTTRKGVSSSTTNTGCVHACRRLIQVMPCVTSGITASELSRYPHRMGSPNHSSSASAMIAASMAKKMKVKEA